ncbi:hypothetical protein ABS858_04390 [Vibrio neptunius]|uniref:hypothetical protein n=1 Tax=Vibrio neptunius TaxID=170651 RepID=UPI00331498AB
MCSVVISDQIKQLLDNVVDSCELKDEASKAAREASIKYQEAQDQVSDFLHEEARKCCEVANDFFIEEGVLYRGKLFHFDDEGALNVVDGPIVAEAASCNTQQ